jgi:hypothetical protein
MLSPPAAAPQRRGASTYNNASLSAGNTDVVTGAANTTGLLVRTAFLGGGTGGSTTLWDGGQAYFAAAPASGASVYGGPGILVPSGSPLRLTSNGGAGSAFITWDVL